jgi:hypothetical protein
MTERAGLSQAQRHAIKRRLASKSESSVSDDIWYRLNDAVNASGEGRITSIPCQQPVRLEVMPGSSMPQTLADKGFDVRFLCQETRLGPAYREWSREGRRWDRNDAYSFNPVEVFEIRYRRPSVTSKHIKVPT